MAIRIAPKSDAVERALPVEKQRFDKTAYQREYMSKRRSVAQLTISVRLPTDIVAAWKATGPGWQERMKKAFGSIKPG